jgi:hypothetical protein
MEITDATDIELDSHFRRHSHFKKHPSKPEEVALPIIATPPSQVEEEKPHTLIPIEPEESFFSFTPVKTVTCLAILGLIVGGVTQAKKKKAQPLTPPAEQPPEEVDPEMRPPTPPPISNSPPPSNEPSPPSPPSEPESPPATPPVEGVARIGTCSGQEMDLIEFIFCHTANDSNLEILKRKSELEAKGKLIKHLHPFVLRVTVKHNYMREILNFGIGINYFRKSRLINEIKDKMVRFLKVLPLHTEDLAGKMGKEKYKIDRFIHSPDWQDKDKGFAHCEAFLKYLFGVK